MRFSIVWFLSKIVQPILASLFGGPDFALLLDTAMAGIDMSELVLQTGWGSGHGGFHCNLMVFLLVLLGFGDYLIDVDDAWRWNGFLGQDSPFICFMQLLEQTDGFRWFFSDPKPVDDHLGQQHFLTLKPRHAGIQLVLVVQDAFIDYTLQFLLWDPLRGNVFSKELHRCGLDLGFVENQHGFIICDFFLAVPIHIFSIRLI